MTTRILTPHDPLANIPHISADPPLRALRATRLELGTRVDGLNARQQEIEQRITLNVSNQTVSVERLLADPLAEVDRSDGLQAELQKALADADIVRRALTVLDMQMIQLESECAGRACAMLQPAHRANVRSTINAMLDLYRATVRQEALRANLVRKGYTRTSHLIPHFPHDFMFGLQDPNSWLSMDLRSAESEGFITPEEYSALICGSIEHLDLDAAAS